MPRHRGFRLGDAPEGAIRPMRNLPRNWKVGAQTEDWIEYHNTKPTGVTYPQVSIIRDSSGQGWTTLLEFVKTTTGSHETITYEKSRSFAAAERLARRYMRMHR